MTSRRSIFSLLVSGLLLAGCAALPAPDEHPPIIFVHGNGDTASLWQTTVWRFESNGWPADRLYAMDIPYPLARDVDSQPQPGRTSSCSSRWTRTGSTAPTEWSDSATDSARASTI